MCVCLYVLIPHMRATKVHDVSCNPECEVQLGEQIPIFFDHVLLWHFSPFRLTLLWNQGAQSGFPSHNALQIYWVFRLGLHKKTASSVKKKKENKASSCSDWHCEV